MNLIQTLEREQMATVRGGRKLPAFRPGDTLKINVKVVDVTYDEKTKQTGRASGFRLLKASASGVPARG